MIRCTMITRNGEKHIALLTNVLPVAQYCCHVVLFFFIYCISLLLLTLPHPPNYVLFLLPLFFLNQIAGPFDLNHVSVLHGTVAYYFLAFTPK